MNWIIIRWHPIDGIVVYGTYDNEKEAIGVCEALEARSTTSTTFFVTTLTRPV